MKNLQRKIYISIFIIFISFFLFLIPQSSKAQFLSYWWFYQDPYKNVETYPYTGFYIKDGTYYTNDGRQITQKIYNLQTIINRIDDFRVIGDKARWFYYHSSFGGAYYYTCLKKRYPSNDIKKITQTVWPCYPGDCPSTRIYSTIVNFRVANNTAFWDYIPNTRYYDKTSHSKTLDSCN